MAEITYDDFAKLDFRIGKILEVERVPNTDKLYKLQVDIGKEKPIQMVSSIVPYYTEQELIGKKIIVLVNLKPTKFAGELSEAMLIATGSDNSDECILLCPEKDVEPGSPVS